jgi:hypothetical protein
MISSFAVGGLEWADVFMHTDWAFARKSLWASVQLFYGLALKGQAYASVLALHIETVSVQSVIVVYDLKIIFNLCVM